MRVKSVRLEKVRLGGPDLWYKPRWAIQFEHDGTVWEKFLNQMSDELTVKDFLNSVLEDYEQRIPFNAR